MITDVKPIHCPKNSFLRGEKHSRISENSANFCKRFLSRWFVGLVHGFWFQERKSKIAITNFRKHTHGRLHESFRKLRIFTLAVLAITVCKALIVPSSNYGNFTLGEQPVTSRAQLRSMQWLHTCKRFAQIWFFRMSKPDYIKGMFF